MQVGITSSGLCGVLNIPDGFARVSAQIDWITDTACSMVEDLCPTVSPTVSPSKDKNEDIYKLFLIHLILLLKKGKAIHDLDLWSDKFFNLEYFFHYLREAHPKLDGTGDDLDEIEIKLIELLEEETGGHGRALLERTIHNDMDNGTDRGGLRNAADNTDIDMEGMKAKIMDVLDKIDG